jgi:hypothetical protein
VTAGDEQFRVRLHAVRGPALPEYRWLEQSSGHLLVDGPWSSDMTMPLILWHWYALEFLMVGLPILAVVAILWLIQDGPPQVALGAVVAIGVLILYLRGHPELLWRGWRLERGAVTREGLQILPRMGVRHFPNVIEFEIAHRVEKPSWFRRGDTGSPRGTDVLLLRPASAGERVIVALRKFHAVHTDDMAEQIDPSLLHLGVLMAQEVGVPLHAVKVVT